MKWINMNSGGDSVFRFAATGDSINTRPVSVREGFEILSDLLRDADATMTNLETVVTEASSCATLSRTVRDQYQYLGRFPAW